MPEDAQIAESSTATVETPVAEVVETPDPGPIESWTQAQRDKFMETGEVPGSKPSKKSDSAPDDKAEAPPTEKADEKPAAEAAPAKPKKSADERVQQVLVDRARERQARQEAEQRLAEAQQELERLKSGGAKPEAKAEAPKGPQEPQRDDYNTLEEYEQAWREYPAKVARAIIAEERAAERAKAEADQRAQYEAEVLAGWGDRFESALEAHPNGAEFEKHVKQAADVFVDSPGISEYIMTDEYGPQMAELLGQDLKRAYQLVKITSPVKLAQALADLKYEVRTGNAQKAPAKAEPELPVTPKPASKASQPPPQLSTAAKAPADEVQAALESGDVQKYMALMNARELKAKRG